MGPIQNSINTVLGSVAAATVAGKKLKDSDIKKEESLKNETTSTKTSLYIAKERANQAAEEVAKADNFTVAKNGKVRDKSSGKIIKKFDAEMRQKALSTAQEQYALATSIVTDFKTKLDNLTGGTK